MKEHGISHDPVHGMLAVTFEEICGKVAHIIIENRIVYLQSTMAIEDIEDVLIGKQQFTGTCLEMFPDYVWENALELLFGRISQRRSQAVTVTVPTHLKIGDTA